MLPSRKLAGLIVLVSLPFAVSSASAEELLNTKPLLKEAVAANPGLELIMPSAVESITPSGYQEELKMKFKVYAAGTLNLLFATPQKKFTPPPVPCNNPHVVDLDWDVGFAGEDNSYTAIGVSFYVECQELNGTWKEDAGAFVYVADTSQSGSAWAKSWNAQLISLNILDWDDDQQDEVQVVLGSETNSQEKMKILFIDKMTGDVESQKSYTYLNVNYPF